MSARAGRYARQVAVPGVGMGGQAALGAAWVRVEGEGLDAEVCALYLVGAGVGRVEVAPSLVAACAALNRDAQISVGVGAEAFGVTLELPGVGTVVAPAPTAREADPVLRGAMSARWVLARILAQALSA